MNFKEILKELLIITIGVFIGLLLNSWNENRKAQREARQYLDGIYEEMTQNIEVLNEALPYHTSLLDQLRKDPTAARLVLKPASVDDLAWKLAENNIFKNNIDKSLYYKIAKTYQIHDLLIEMQDQASERMSELNIMSPFYELQFMNIEIDEEIQARVIQAWIPIFETWTSYESDYLEALKKTVEELKEEL
ncbi:MAG: hypothetical protein MI974_03990 [Chitinophagales bacterium]|nr:hypothetical protein [Chitinophagales bacterium]